MPFVRDEPVSRPHVQPVDSTDADIHTLGAFIAAGQASDAEVAYYEAFSDPHARAMNRARRKANGQYLRRIRRRAHDK